ncbi:MAG: RHS repeat protein [Candidatus Omnitrophica bacterium]|nr:RHS repeat protein [Candidatus Omnitrophota bacterium]
MAYDNVSRLTTRANPSSQTVYYGYDAVGNRTNLKDPDPVFRTSRERYLRINA